MADPDTLGSATNPSSPATLALRRPQASVYIPDDAPQREALARTTDLVIAAHPDDVEIMAIAPVLECFGREDRWLTAVVVCDGAGSAREGDYAALTDEEMKRVRRREQRKAAHVGEYAALVMLDYPSRAVQAGEARIIDDLVDLLSATRPRAVYTHNLADRHDTHVATALRAVAACRRLAPERRPERVVGCEVWRDLDWVPESRKVRMPLRRREHLQAALLGVFDSQIAGGKRYDQAALGRRRAHATYSESHEVDRTEGLVLGMDLQPLVEDHSADPSVLAAELIRAFEADVLSRLRRLA